MRNLLLVAPLALMGCASAPSEPSAALEDRVSSLVEVFYDGQLYCTGSAAPVGNGIYLTAYHVVDLWDDEYMSENYTISIQIDGFWAQEVMHLGDLDAALVLMDPALLEEGQEFLTPWPLSLRTPSVGEEIIISGWGLGSFWMTEGRATTDADRLSVPVSPGDSGCPFFREDVGAILGIIVAKDTRAPNHCYVVPMSEIFALIPDAVRDRLVVLR